MGAEGNSGALSVKKGIAEGISEKCILCFKKHSLTAVDLWSELWGMNLQFLLFHSSGGGARRGGNKGGKRWETENQLQSPLTTVSIHLLNIWFLATLAWYPCKWKSTVGGTWQVKAYWAPGRGLWYLSSSDTDRGTLTCPIYHLQTGTVLPALPFSRDCDKEPICDQMTEWEILSTWLKALR